MITSHKCRKGLKSVILIGAFVCLTLFIFQCNNFSNHNKLNYWIATDPACSKTAVTEPSPDKIVRIIHQSWKTTELPPNFKHWSKSWKTCFPDWEYKLWTDSDNLNLIKEDFPWFLSFYEKLTSIKKADVMRAFYMFRFGGLYVDLDAECLRPFQHLIWNVSIAFGAMIGDNNLVPEGYTQNSFMYSRAGELFWLDFINKVMLKKDEGRPEYQTGPFPLMETIKEFRERKSILSNSTQLKVFPPKYFNPFSWIVGTTINKACKDLNRMTSSDYENCKRLYKESYVIQYHAQSWLAGAVNTHKDISNSSVLSPNNLTNQVH